MLFESSLLLPFASQPQKQTIFDCPRTENGVQTTTGTSSMDGNNQHQRETMVAAIIITAAPKTNLANAHHNATNEKSKK